jgi:hypothetical protein
MTHLVRQPDSSRSIRAAHTARPTSRARPWAIDAAALAHTADHVASVSPDRVMMLQCIYGNRAVQRLIQAKLSVGPAGDKYEQEADRVADQVMRLSVPAPSKPAAQHKDEDEAVQLKSSMQPVRGEGGFEVNSAIEGRLAQRQGSGAPLSNDIQAFMESRFGADFSHVRVHTDREAAQLNRDLQAQAFTHGTDIYLGEGKYSPDTSAGKRLLAHELTHVAQQSGSAASIQRKKNEFVTKDVDSTQPLKDEIRSQYTEPPDGEFETLWGQSFLTSIVHHQAKGGRPYNSEVLLSTTEDDDRGSNPSSVTVHGSIGNLEAALRGNPQAAAFTQMKQRSGEEKEKPNKDVTATKLTVPTASQQLEPKQLAISPKENKEKAPKHIEPAYDGGHLVAYQFLGKDANVYDNVAPQGKALNNGPFQNWEKKVLAAAIDQTALTLQMAGVAEENIPHTFRYRVHVSYPAGFYSIAPATLAQFGLIPLSDVGKLNSPVRLTKRIPESWYATAQPLPFPSRDELKAKQRPDTPFVLASTTDYGIVDEENKERTNQEYIARGPEELVKKFASKAKAKSPADDFAMKLAVNATKSGFVTLQKWDAEKQSDLGAVKTWALNPWHTDKITIPKIKTSGKHVLKKYEGEKQVLKSNWQDPVTKKEYSPDELIKLATTISTADETDDHKMLAAYLNDHNAVGGILTGLKKATEAPIPIESNKQKVKRPSTPDTNIDFSSMMELTGQNLLPNNVRFQFEAKDTQPD